MKRESPNLGTLFLAVIAGAILGGVIVFAFTSDEAAPIEVADRREDQRVDPATRLTSEAAHRRTTNAPVEGAGRESIGSRPARPKESFGVIVYGLVHARDGSPITEPIYINFQAPDGNQVRKRNTRFESGGYSIHGLFPGAWGVNLRGKGITTSNIEVTILDQEVQRLDLVVDRSFTVQVKMRTPEGQPLYDAMMKANMSRLADRLVAVATIAPPEGNLPMTRSRTHWRFGIGRWRATRGMGRLSEQSPDVMGELEFDVAPPVFVSAVMRHHVLATKRVDVGQEELVFELSLEDIRSTLTKITVKVVDADTMTPIAKATVLLGDSQSSGGLSRTDETGQVVLEDQPPGLLELDIYAKGYASHSEVVRLNPGAHDLGTIRIWRPRTIEGRVVDQSGKPQSAEISWTRMTQRTDVRRPRKIGSASTTAGGKIAIKGCAPGRYIIQATSDKGMATVDIDTARLGGKPFELMLKPVETLAVDALKTPPHKQLALRIYDEKNLLIAARLLWVRFVYDIKLPEGRYRYELHDDLTLWGKGMVTVKIGGKPRIVVR